MTEINNFNESLFKYYDAKKIKNDNKSKEIKYPIPVKIVFNFMFNTEFNHKTLRDVTETLIKTARDKMVCFVFCDLFLRL